MKCLPVIDTAERTAAIHRLRALWQHGQGMAPENLLGLLLNGLDPSAIDSEAHQIALAMIRLTEGNPADELTIELWVERVGDITDLILDTSALVNEMRYLESNRDRDCHKRVVVNSIKNITEMWDETFDPDSPRFALPA